MPYLEGEKYPLADAETNKLTDEDLRAYSTEYSASRYSPPLVFADKWEFGNFVDECAKWGAKINRFGL